jgi:hypothetical protein
MKEVPDRKVTQNKRLDEAVKKVEEGMTKASGVFAERLHQEMNLKHYGARSEAARAMKSACSTVNLWEQFTPQNFHKLRELCKFLDIDANYLLGLSRTRRTLSEAIIGESPNINFCKHCQCSELLCGEGGVGCTSARANQ